ncbi:MAG: Spx/MgsR family RNA polymerase-binding regulatory protein [Parvularculaceae bacterium]|nr:Spx/MgsR family RNA polymerase-binding regulatory protein [Parvularculaceae bacterium]
MVDVYGLKNCDTCRKVRKELDRAKIAYDFHDVREAGVTKAQIARWAKAAGWEKLLNKSSATWRALADADKAELTEAKALALMAANPALIKRPVIERDGTDVFVGWTKDVADAVKK